MGNLETRRKPVLLIPDTSHFYAKKMLNLVNGHMLSEVALAKGWNEMVSSLKELNFDYMLPNAVAYQQYTLTYLTLYKTLQIASSTVKDVVKPSYIHRCMLD